LGSKLYSEAIFRPVLTPLYPQRPSCEESARERWVTVEDMTLSLRLIQPW
jgi:hypothetical protein